MDVKTRLVHSRYPVGKWVQKGYRYGVVRRHQLINNGFGGLLIIDWTDGSTTRETALTVTAIKEDVL